MATETETENEKTDASELATESRCILRRSRVEHERVLAEKCAGDERHCACVPSLRREIARLRGKPSLGAREAELTAWEIATAEIEVEDES